MYDSFKHALKYLEVALTSSWIISPLEPCEMDMFYVQNPGCSEVTWYSTHECFQGYLRSMTLLSLNSVLAIAYLENCSLAKFLWPTPIHLHNPSQMRWGPISESKELWIRGLCLFRCQGLKCFLCWCVLRDSLVLTVGVNLAFRIGLPAGRWCDWAG